MSYTKQTWTSGDVITAAKLNNIENGIETIDNNFITPSEDNTYTLLGIEKYYTKGDIIVPEQNISGSDGTGLRLLSNINTNLMQSATAIFIEINGKTTFLYTEHYPWYTIYNQLIDIQDNQIYIYVGTSSATYTVKVYKAIPNIEYAFIDEYDIIINAYSNIGYSYIMKMNWNKILNKLINKQPIKGVVLLYNEGYNYYFQKYELQQIDILKEYSEGQDALSLQFSLTNSTIGTDSSKYINVFSYYYTIVNNNEIPLIDDRMSSQAYLANTGLSTIFSSQYTGAYTKSSGGTTTIYINKTNGCPCIILVIGSQSEDYAVALYNPNNLIILNKGNNITLTELADNNSNSYRIQISQTTNRGYKARWISLN